MTNVAGPSRTANYAVVAGSIAIGGIADLRKSDAAVAMSDAAQARPTASRDRPRSVRGTTAASAWVRPLRAFQPSGVHGDAASDFQTKAGTMDSISELLEDELKDLYSAETQLLRAMPKVAKKVTTPILKDAFNTHLEQTKVHVERLIKIGEILGYKKMTGKTCQAMKGLITEAQELLSEEDPSEATDAALIGSAQRIEHYEIAGYGTVRALAKSLKLKEVVDVLSLTLKEEGDTDKLLSRIAEKDVIPAALKAGQDAG
jgi:ferritin-like metal-binding protein YciE